jgi:DNA-directed RNA polymerase subunit H (RpoH/RPB5)
MTDILFNNDKHLKACLNTLLEKDGLLDKRKYIINQNYDTNDIKTINNNNYYELIAKSDNNYIFIYFVNNTNFLNKTNKQKVGNLFDIEKTIKQLYKVSEINNICLLVILTQQVKINTQILEKKISEKINIPHIQVFQYNNLLFNISKHNLLPKSIRVISDTDEIKQICELKNIEKTQLPKILITDPISYFYGIRKGQLFEFKRPSRNTGEYIYYRLCTT